MLKQIAESLRVKGYEVTEPKPGKACHGACRAIFPDVEVAVVLLVSRRKGKIEFRILTWPSQTLQQRLRRHVKVARLSGVGGIVCRCQRHSRRGLTIGITSVESLHGSRR
jgi:hypothetical protein